MAVTEHALQLSDINVKSVLLSLFKSTTDVKRDFHYEIVHLTKVLQNLVRILCGNIVTKKTGLETIDHLFI